MNSTVSVIIPCYNAGKFIDMSIRSVFEQNYQDVELIVVNDGSTDNSEEKILSWKEPFENKGYTFKYLYQENQGQGAAVSAALKYVSGDYLTLLDADDKYLQGSVFYRAAYLDANPDYAGVRSNGWIVNGDERHLFITDENEKNIVDVFTALTYQKTNNWAGSYMVRTSVLFDIYPDRNIYPSRQGQNFQILLPVAYKRKFGYVDLPLMEYFQYENSHSHASSPEKQYEMAERNTTGWREIYHQIIDLVESDPKEKEKYIKGYDSTYYRGKMHRAIAHKKHDVMHVSYQLLKATGHCTTSDRIMYYGAINSPIVVPLKVIRRIKRMVTKEK